jgi:hypothetical protein
MRTPESAISPAKKRSATAASARPAPASLTKGERRAAATAVRPDTIRSDSPEGRLRQVLVAVVAFRDGDFSVRLPAEWSGTEGRIAEAFNEALAYEDRTAQEVTRLSITVGKEGRLRQRMSLPGAIGQWATRVDLLNTLLDDLVRPTTDVARTIGAGGPR